VFAHTKGKRRNVSKYADYQAQALECLREMERDDLSDERRNVLKWMADQWLTLAAEHATSEGFEPPPIPRLPI
jgi:hypothetical protein